MLCIFTVHSTMLHVDIFNQVYVLYQVPPPHPLSLTITYPKMGTT